MQREICLTLFVGKMFGGKILVSQNIGKNLFVQYLFGSQNDIGAKTKFIILHMTEYCHLKSTYNYHFYFTSQSQVNHFICLVFLS